MQEEENLFKVLKRVRGLLPCSTLRSAVVGHASIDSNFSEHHVFPIFEEIPDKGFLIGDSS